MLSIGEFARFAGVSVRMLRHYDALGLLAPTHVDPHTGYRSYDPALLARADTLVALKELGFTLEQVGTMLDQRLTREDLAALLASRRDELRDQIRADQSRLAEVERRLRMLEGATVSASSLEFVEKPLPELELAQVTDQVEDVAELHERVGPLFGRLFGTLGAAGATPPDRAYGWYDADGAGMRFGAGVEMAPVDGLERGVLPACDRAVTAVYRGSMAGITEAWQDLARHIAETGLEFAGPGREVYLESPPDDPEAWVTELQQPVR